MTSTVRWLPLLLACACVVNCRRVATIANERQPTSVFSLADVANSSTSGPKKALASYLFATNPTLAHRLPNQAIAARSINQQRPAPRRKTVAMVYEWEESAMPTYDYRMGYYKKLMAGMTEVRKENQRMVTLLQQLRTKDFFAFFAADLMASCRFMPTEEIPCELDKCEVEPADSVPEVISVRDGNEYEFEMDGWSRKDMPSDFTEYFDLREEPEKNTGYNGTRVWRFIHKKICFNRDIHGKDSGWKRDFNRAASGMHAAVNAQILADIGFNEEGLAEYHRRLRDEPGAIANLYFAYMLTLNAIHELRERLDNCNYLGEGDDIRPIMQEITGSGLLESDAVQEAANNLRRHALERNSSLVWKMRLRSRNINSIMDCVQCNACRLHGKVMALGLGATLQVLLGSDGKGGDPKALDRAQVAALVVTATKFGVACETVEKFRELDGEDMSKNFDADT